MLYLDIRGFGARKKLCADVMDYFFEKYLPRHKINITVQHRGLAREGVYGWCSIAGETRNPRDFLIEIHNRLNKEDYIKTLFHECTHILQNVSGDLKERAGKQIWKGIDYTDADYENSPWEKEALENEDKLYHEYLTWG